MLVEKGIQTEGCGRDEEMNPEGLTDKEDLKIKSGCFKWLISIKYIKQDM